MVWLARPLFAVTSVACLAALPLSADARDGFRLTILHTNDLHSIYHFIDMDLNPCERADAIDNSCFIPVVRLSTAIKEARARNINSLLLDAGDQFPTPRFPLPADVAGPLAAKLMNLFRYDAMTLGNHEFDAGAEVLAAFVDALVFPVLTADGRVLSDPLFEKSLAPTVILEVGGEQIGLIGLGAAGSDFDAPAPHVLAQRYADQLTAQGINKIIAISHLGFDADRRIAAMTTGIDVIVGGHTHTRLSNAPMGRKLGMTYPTLVNDVMIVQAYAYGAFLGELHLTFDALGNVVNAHGDPIPMDSVEDDVEIVALVEEAATRIEAIGK